MGETQPSTSGDHAPPPAQLDVANKEKKHKKKHKKEKKSKKSKHADEDDDDDSDWIPDDDIADEEDIEGDDDEKFDESELAALGAEMEMSRDDLMAASGYVKQADGTWVLPQGEADDGEQHGAQSESEDEHKRDEGDEGNGN